MRIGGSTKMVNPKKYRNFMDELYSIIREIDCLKPEPEICNVRCPPLGCPRGPCPGMCCYEGVCDPCCMSQMPCCPPPPPHPPRCCLPTRSLKRYVGTVNCESCPRTYQYKMSTLPRTCSAAPGYSKPCNTC